MYVCMYVCVHVYNKDIPACARAKHRPCTKLNASAPSRTSVSSSPVISWPNSSNIRGYTLPFPPFPSDPRPLAPSPFFRPLAPAAIAWAAAVAAKDAAAAVAMA